MLFVTNKCHCHSFFCSVILESGQAATIYYTLTLKWKKKYIFIYIIFNNRNIFYVYNFMRPFFVDFKLYSDYLLISLNIEPLSHC